MCESTLPLCPKFIPVEASDIGGDDSSGFTFRLVSYNILAQVFVKSSYFPHSPKPCLRWKARSQATLTVLKSLQADFLCLQELDEYDSFYRGNMESCGYSSIYIQRTGEKRDGCGIFYKHDRVELLMREEIEYNDLANSIEDEISSITEKFTDAVDIGNNKSEDDVPQKSNINNKGDMNDPSVRLKRDCVGIMAAFQLKDPSHHLVIVANTHIFWNPELADVKLAQVKYLISRLIKFKEYVSDKFESIPSVIIAGDFNSTPGDKVYRYMVSADSSESQKVNERRIPLYSLYAYNGGSEPSFTNWSSDFTGTLDYIFVSPSDFLRPVSLLQLPSRESSDVIGGLPNYHHPSDHLPIGADFLISQKI